MYYIGIGASAGGQGALCEFLDHLDPTLDAAYFITTHLSRSHRSFLDEILQRHTKMTVLRVMYRMEIRPKTIYVQPEDASLVFEQQYVLTEKRGKHETVNKSINASLKSLALIFQKKAIGIILSGTGQDGTDGILSIEANGGRVIVQDPTTADYRGMPDSAIANDHPLAICNPSQLADKVKAMICSILPGHHFSPSTNDTR
jgi:chemotaxis response regulator CheB